MCVASFPAGGLAVPAAASTGLQTIARVGNPAAGGGTLSGFVGSSISIQAARAGTLIFEGYVNNVPGGRLYRYSPGTGIQLLTLKAGDPRHLGDDGTVAWATGSVDAAGCYLAVVPPGTTRAGSAGCPSGNRRALNGGSVSDLAVVNGQVYFLGSYDPSPADHGDDDPRKRTGFGVFTGRDTRVAPLTYPKGWQGQYTLGIDPVWDPYVSIPSLYGGADAPYVESFRTTTSALFRVENGGITPVLGAGSGIAVPSGTLGKVVVGADRIVFGGGASVYELKDGKVRNLTAKYGRLFISNSAYVFGHLTPGPSGVVDRLVTLEPDGLRTLVGTGSRTVDGATVTSISSAFATPAEPDGTLALLATTSKGGRSAAAVLLVPPAPTAPFVVIHPSSLDGAAVAPRDIGALDFANVAFGDTSHPETLTVTNGGNVTLDVRNVVMPTGRNFNKGADTCTGQTVDPGKSCTIEVTFAPRRGGREQSGEIKITDDAPGSPHYVSLRGTATNSPLRPAVVEEYQGEAYGSDPCNGRPVGWALIPDEQQPQILVGQVVEGHVATEDFTGVHDNADYNFFVYPDQGHRGLLSKPGNFQGNKDDYTPSEDGRIEVEWERQGATHEARDGLPAWAWPTVGDKVKVVGWHILDCGHGAPDYRSEIHPPLFVATYRNAALSPFAGSSARLGSYDSFTKRPTTRVDVYASNYGGPAVGIEQENEGQWVQGVNKHTYQFDAMAPPKPSPDAVLAPPDVLVLHPTPDGKADLSWTPLPSGRGYHFTLKFAGYGLHIAYGARISVEWKDPNASPPTVTTYEVTPEWIRVFHKLTGEWALYGYVNEDQTGSLLTGSGENSNHEKFRQVEDGECVFFQKIVTIRCSGSKNTYLRVGKMFTVTVVRGQPLHVAFRVSSFKHIVGVDFGSADFAGTAAEFFTDPSSLPDKEEVTLKGGGYLGDLLLGRDEWNRKCPCYEIAFTIRRL